MTKIDFLYQYYKPEELDLQINHTLRSLNWFKIDCIAKVLFAPKDSTQLGCFLQNKSKDLQSFILGLGSNVLFTLPVYDGVVIKLNNFNHISHDSNTITVGAGVPNSRLSLYCMQNNMTDLEFLSGIPGCIGGALAMNAGCFGSELADIFISAEGFSYEGKKHILTQDDIKFLYRKTIVDQPYIWTSVKLKYTSSSSDIISEKISQIRKLRTAAQPQKVLTAGSTFKNPENYKAWELIDGAGGRGLQVGGAKMSELHCNFMIVEADVTASDILELGTKIKNMVLEKYNINLEWEIVLVGEQ